MVATAPAAPSSLAGPSAQGGSASRIAVDHRGATEGAPENVVSEHLARRRPDHAGATCIGRPRPHRRDAHRGRRRFSGHTRIGRYCRARYYHPGLQRFISEDPFRGRDGDWNAYAYARNRPLNFTDPLGLFNLLVGANASAIGVTGVEGSVGGFVNYGGGTQQPDVGGFVYAGMGTGVDVGYGGFVGVVFGGTDAVAGVTANITVSIGIISVSSLYGANGWAGFTIGVGPTAVPFGGSATVGKTGTLTLSEALDMAFGKRPPAGGSPSSSGPPKSKSSR